MAQIVHKPGTALVETLVGKVQVCLVDSVGEFFVLNVCHVVALISTVKFVVYSV